MPMRSRLALSLGAGRRACVLAILVAQSLGCATWNWNPFADDSDDPMTAEMKALEAEQKRMVREERAIEESRQKDRAENPLTLEDRLERGDDRLAKGEISAAVWEYGAAHKIEPGSPEPRVRLGYVHLRAQPERARPLFESALEIDPDHASAHRGLGLSLFAAGGRDEGIAHLEQAVNLAPRSSMAREALGVSLDEVGRREEARTQLEKAAELAPKSSTIQSNLGSFYLRIGEYENAARHLRAALRLDTRDTALRENNLGLALAMQGRFEEALAAFRRAGDEQNARANLGFAHFERGEYDLAIEEYEAALVAGGPANVQVVKNLKAARRALAASGNRATPRRGVADRDAAPRPGEGDAAEVAESSLDRPAPVGETTKPPRGDDPWLWEAPPPGAAAE